MIKTTLQVHTSMILRGIWASIACIFTAGVAYSNPQLNNVAAGQAQVLQTQNKTTINQTSQRAVINWHSFNIGKGESTHFQQPAGGVAFNRINPQQGASSIYGKLTATGQIILSNPAGIYFGPNSFVNVGGMIATTANIADEDFMQGHYQFLKVNGYNGAVINDGAIYAAQHGLVALVAPGVVNNGVIHAKLGQVILASGEAFTVSFSTNNLINFKIDASTTQPGKDRFGNRLKNGVSNTGKIIANGGTVLLSAKTAQGILDNVINLEDVVKVGSFGLSKV